MLRCTLRLVVLLLLLNSAVAIAIGNPYHQLHTCHFDDIHAIDGQNLPTVTRLSSDPTADSSKKYMRINFSTANLEDGKKHCKYIWSEIKDMEGRDFKCHSNDVLSASIKKNLMKIVRSGIAMHAERLKVLPMSDQGFKVPSLHGALCRLFAVPEEHKTTGVTKTDFMLYVASFPSSTKDMLAAGAPCAKIDDGRPVVGALTYVTREIDSSVYHARVAAHEIAHALGFTYKIMKERIGSFMLNSYVRYKTVEEIHSPKVKRFSNIHYNCDREWGVELEDEGGVLSVRSRSHWERHNVLEELMVGVVTAGYYTYLTLALFHDLGFYEADFSKAETMEWGKDLGCNFLNARCFEGGVPTFPRFFCDAVNSGDNMCTAGRRAVGRCSFPAHIYSPREEYTYMWEYKIFWYDYYTGEPQLLTDRCPIFGDVFFQSCQDTKSNVEGIKGKDSWCLRKIYSGSNNINGALCGKVTVESDGEVYAQIDGSKGKTRCEKKGNIYVADIYHGWQWYKFECPTREEVIQSTKMDKMVHDASEANESGIIPVDEPRRW